MSSDLMGVSELSDLGSFTRAWCLTIAQKLNDSVRVTAKNMQLTKNTVFFCRKINWISSLSTFPLPLLSSKGWLLSRLHFNSILFLKIKDRHSFCRIWHSNQFISSLLLPVRWLCYRALARPFLGHTCLWVWRAQCTAREGRSWPQTPWRGSVSQVPSLRHRLNKNWKENWYLKWEILEEKYHVMQVNRKVRDALYRVHLP